MYRLDISIFSWPLQKLTLRFFDDIFKKSIIIPMKFDIATSKWRRSFQPWWELFHRGSKFRTTWATTVAMQKIIFRNHFRQCFEKPVRNERANGGQWGKVFFFCFTVKSINRWRGCGYDFAKYAIRPRHATQTRILWTKWRTERFEKLTKATHFEIWREICYKLLRFLGRVKILERDR